MNDGNGAEARGFPPIPNGWFAVAFSSDLLDGEVKRARYFGEELVLFRTRTGQAKVLSAYCSHLGAHLAEGGRVAGETIRCPFHAWQYDGDSGKCVAIPYAKHIPEKARVRAWPVCERNHMIFVWHHDRGAAPQWELPVISELDDDEWTESRQHEFEVATHVQDTHENNCDPIHFHYVHGQPDVPESEISYEEGGRFMRIRSNFESVTSMGTFQAELERDSWGMGLASVRVKGIPGAGLLMFSSTSPIDRSHVRQRWLFTVTKNLVDVAGEDFIVNIKSGVIQDLPIWENKIHRANPVLCDGDTYIAEYRKWVKQFYSEPS